MARMEEGRIAFKILTDAPAGKRPLGRPRHRWKGNIRMDLKKIVIDKRGWVDFAQDRISEISECGQEPPVFERVALLT